MNSPENILFVKVNKTNIETELNRHLTSGSVGITVKFIFDSTWNNLTKSVVFKVNDKLFKVLLSSDNICTIPWELLVDEEVGSILYVGLCGFKEDKIVYPTIYGYVAKIVQGACQTGTEPLEPTTPIVIQILEKAENAERIAQSVRNDANLGKFNGKDGLTPNIQIGTVESILFGEKPEVTITGTTENPLFNFKIVQGEKGDKGDSYTLTDQDKKEISDLAVKSVVETVIDDKSDATNKVLSSKKFYEEIKRPQHNVMVVTAMQEGIGFKSDYNASQIKRHKDGGGLVLLNFFAPDGTGEQSYRLETVKNGLAIFRRPVVNPENHEVSRIIITIDDRYNVSKTDEKFTSASMQDIQDLEDSKANYTYKVIANDYVSQSDAREVLTFLDQYEGKLIEFLTNGDNPSKCVATGRVMTDKSGNSYLITYNKDGTSTQWNKESYEKHNFECKSFINEPMVDIDNLTIDTQGEAPYLVSVQKAFNKPPNTSDFGIVIIIAYSIEKQVQLYRDVESGKTFSRTVTGKADRHSFDVWKETNSLI